MQLFVLSVATLAGIGYLVTGSAWFLLPQWTALACLFGTLAIDAYFESRE